ncbi:MAG: YetF domain-containing protein [Pseudomonadota bacterium]
MLFDSWAAIVRVIVIGTLAYVVLVVLLRGFGKRSLSKLNAFDLVVTVALGSTLATVVLSKDIALAEGVTAFTLLLLLQYAIAWLSVRWNRFEHLVKAEPTVLVSRSAFLDGAMRRERISKEEVLAAVRGAGAADLSQIDAVILEADGSISVLRQPTRVDAGPS